MNNIKFLIKKNIKIYKFLIKAREILRIIYNTKTRSRFLWTVRKVMKKYHLTIP